MRTGAHLKIESMGEVVQGVRLLGDPRKPEPEHFRVCFPGGDVDVVRLDDRSYWIHVRVNRPDDGDDPNREFAKLTDARLDVHGKHAAETNAGDFKHPGLYHVALKIKPERVKA